MTYANTSSARQSFIPVFVTGMLVIIVSYFLILCTSADTRSDALTSYVVSEDVSVYDLARSISSGDANVWEIVYRIKDINNIDGEFLAADTTVRIPSGLIEAAPDCGGIYLCSVD